MYSVFEKKNKDENFDETDDCRLSIENCQISVKKQDSIDKQLEFKQNKKILKRKFVYNTHTINQNNSGVFVYKPFAIGGSFEKQPDIDKPSKIVKYKGDESISSKYNPLSTGHDEQIKRRRYDDAAILKDIIKYLSMSKHHDVLD
jgi:hypothetical protein